MLYKYPLIFSDKFDNEESICYSNGSLLILTLRNIKLKGTSFNMLECCDENRKNNLQSKFEIDNFGMILGVFKLQLPIQIYIQEIKTEANLSIVFDYQNGNNITYSFYYNHIIYHNDKSYDCVEDVLISIQKELPEDYKLKCCIACQFSSYHPIGNNDFGGLGCFKNLKKELEHIKHKDSLMELWKKGWDENKLLNIQETFICSEFEEPKDNIWLYKSF